MTPASFPFRAGHVVQVHSSLQFSLKRFTLSGEAQYIGGARCWRVPSAWELQVESKAAIFLPESHLYFVHDGNIKTGWSQGYWHPHLDVIRHPTKKDVLINVWEPVPVLRNGEKPRQNIPGNIPGEDDE